MNGLKACQKVREIWVEYTRKNGYNKEKLFIDFGVQDYL